MNNRGINKNTHSFEGGLQRDIATSRFPQNAYFETNGFKLSSSGEGSFYSIQNMEGSLNKFIMFGVTIIYMLEALDSLIFFGYTNSDTIIYRVSKAYLEENSNIEINDITTYYHNSSIGHGLIFKFGYVQTEIAFAKYNYESDSIQKIYWKDTEFRHLNINNSTDNNVETIAYEDTLTFTDLLTEKAQFEDYIPGNLFNGTYFYTYQLYNKYGSESAFAPLMGPIYLTNNYSKTDYKKVGNGQVGDNSNQGVYGKIENINTKFTRIRIVSVFYASKESLPIISVIEEKNISNKVYFSDTGVSLGNLSPNELLFRNIILNPDTIEEKDNILFLGSINKKDYFDVDEWIAVNTPENAGLVTDTDDNTFWDSRVFSFNFTAGDYLQTVYDEGELNKIYLQYNLTTEKIERTVTLGGDVLGSLENQPIPKTHDCIYDGIADIKNTDCLFEGTLDANADFGLNPSSIINGKAVYGGFGVNITYRYLIRAVNLNGIINKDSFEDDIVSPSISNGFFNDFTDPVNTQKLAIPYDEVERYGIQFMEISTGRLSYVKWIGDLRSPEPYCFQSGVSTGEIVRTWNSDTTTNTNATLYIRFTIANIPTGLKWRIVRVPKEVESDYSNKAIGALQYIWYCTVDGWTEKAFNNYYLGNQQSKYMNMNNVEVSYWNDALSVPYDLSASYRHASIISPDLLLTNKEVSGAIYGKSFGKLEFPKTASFFPPSSDFFNFSVNYLNWLTQDITRSDIIDENLEIIKNLKAPDPSDSYMYDIKNIALDTTAGGEPRYFYNYVTCILDDITSDWDSSFNSVGGSRLLLDGGVTGIGYNPDGTFSDNRNGQIYALKQDNYTARYGGPSYNDRSFNIYNPISEFTADASINIYGDHYFGIFEYLNGYINDIGFSDFTGSSFIYFPTISRYNFNLGSQSLFRKQTVKDTYNAINRHESKGIYTRQEDVQQLYDIYDHNDAYDITNAFLEVAISTPFDFNSDKFDLEIISSNAKILREYTDSWLKYTDNKSLYLSSKLGKLSKIVTFKDRVYFFQEKGFGTLYVNERQNFTSNQESITIGKGGVLEGYQILSQDKGCSNKDLVVSSDIGIYWIDEKKKEFNIYNGQQLVNLGMKTAMASFFKDADIEFTNISYDPQLNEVIINYTKTSTGFEYFLFYNEDYGQFTGMILARNSKFVTLDSQLYLSYGSSFNKISGGNRNKFLNKRIIPSITFIDNPAKTQTYVLEGLELLIDTFNSVGEFQNSEASSILAGITITNNYEKADAISSASFKKTLRKFRTNNINVTVDTDRPDKLTDYFSKIEIRFKQTEGFKYILHELNSYFSITREI